MNYSTIKYCDIANGLGVRTSIFVSGCTNHCKNCFQPETWDFNYGNQLTDTIINDIIKSIKPSYIRGLTILGGEPMEPANQYEVLHLIQEVRKEYGNFKDIWLYSGFTFEDMYNWDSYCCTDYTSPILHNIDVLVDGRFVEELKDIRLRFRGSSNQRVIDIQSTLKENHIVLLEV